MFCETLSLSLRHPVFCFILKLYILASIKYPFACYFISKACRRWSPCVCRGTISEHSCRKISQNKEAPERARALTLVHIKWTLSKNELAAIFYFPILYVAVMLGTDRTLWLNVPS